MDLGAPHQVSAVKVVTSAQGWKAQVRVSDTPDAPKALDGFTEVAALAADAPRTDLDVPARRVLVWVTQLPPDRRMTIGEIEITGR